MSTMGSRIKEVREKLGLKQEDFASHFQVSRAFISAIEKDKSKFSVDNLIKLLVDYKINVNYVLAGIGEMFIEDCSLDLQNKIHQTVKNMILSGEFCKYQKLYLNSEKMINE